MNRSRSAKLRAKALRFVEFVGNSVTTKVCRRLLCETQNMTPRPNEAKGISSICECSITSYGQPVGNLRPGIKPKYSGQSSGEGRLDGNREPMLRYERLARIAQV